MSRNLEIRPQAEDDIDDAFRHYHGISIRLGSDFIEELDGVFSRILDKPAIYQSVHRDLHRALLKRLPCADFYTFTDQMVHVFAVFHQARDPQRWQR